MTGIETTLSFADTFQRDDENPLSTGGWTSTTLRLLSGSVISTSQDLWGRAVQTTSIPRSANQEVGAELGCGRDSLFGMLGITSLVAGFPGVLTTAAPHGVPVATVVRLVMFGVTLTAGVGAVSPNGLVFSATSSGADTFTLGIDLGTFTTTNAVVMPWENFIAVAGRITGAATPPTTFQNGYLLALNYEAAAVRRLLVLRYFWDGFTGDRLALLGQTTVTLRSLNASDLSLGQEIRLTITQDGESVRLRGYANNDNDDAPNIDVIDRGRGFYLSDATPHFPPPSAPGYFAILVGDDNLMTPAQGLRNGCVLMGFYGRDNAKVEVENPYAGRTLAQLRASVERKVNRTTQTNKPGLTTNQFLNEAQDEFIAAIGGLDLFRRRTELLTLKSDTYGRIYLPREVESVEFIWDAAGCSMHWWLRDLADDGILVIGMNNGPGEDGSDYMVTFTKRHAPMLNDIDRTIVPRRMDEALVVGAAMRWTENDSDGAFYRAMAARWAQAVTMGRQHMGRIQRMTKGRMTTTLRRRGPWSRYVPDPRDLGWPW